jgi:hypothetical protein
LQVALTVVLIAGAFAAANRLRTLLRVPLGFSPDSVVVIGAVPTNLDGPALRAFYNQAVDELTAMENVEVASATDWMPLDSTRPRGETVVAANANPISVANVFHGYFETIAVSPVRGRTFSQNDTAPGSQVAVINESASKLLFAGTDPLGGTVRTTSNRIAEVIGVVPDVRMAIGQEPPPLVYLPPGAIFGRLTMLARLRSRAGAGPMELRRTVSGFDKGMPVTVSWWSSLIKSMAEFRAPRFQAFLLVSFSIIGILVTKLGIYAAISFAVAARSQELAIRAALGASEKSIAANVLWRALFPVSLGIILGVGLTWVIRNSVRAQMFGFEPEVSAGLFVAAAVILAVATLAAYAPARRAGRTDPIGALKLGRSGR